MVEGTAGAWDWTTINTDAGATAAREGCAVKYNPTIVSAYYRQELSLSPEFEVRFHPDRKWRFDLAWPEFRIAIEVQGGLFVRGGHNRGAQIIRDQEKMRAALELGWLVTYCIPQDLCTSTMVQHVRKLMERQLHSRSECARCEDRAHGRKDEKQKELGI